MAWLLPCATLALLGWLWLLLGRRGFWRARPLIEDAPWSPPPAWPAVVAIVPARDEAEVLPTTLTSLFAQDYPGELAIVLVDDHSTDSTAAIARQLAQTDARRLELVAAPPLIAGWSGKLWAVASGLRQSGPSSPPAPYLLLTDADIEHAPDNLVRLVAKAEAERLDLVSLMVQLHCASFWERLLMPPFVFFFRCCTRSPPSTTRDRALRRPPAAACWCGGRPCRRPAASRRSAAR